MKVIHRKVLCCTVIKGVIFRPGMNSISDSEFKEIVDTNAFKSEINCGNMVLGGSYETENTNVVEAGSMKERGEKQSQEIATMSVRDAEKVISGLSDTTVLQAIVKNGAKKGIVDAAEKRIKAVKNQEGADIQPETRVAPEGTGEDLVGAPEKITQEVLNGSVATSAIPALKA